MTLWSTEGVLIDGARKDQAWISAQLELKCSAVRRSAFIAPVEGSRSRRLISLMVRGINVETLIDSEIAPNRISFTDLDGAAYQFKVTASYTFGQDWVQFVWRVPEKLI